MNKSKELDVKVNFTIFILFDLGYQFTTRTDFYGVLPEVYKNVTVKYITPEAIDEDKKKLMSKFDLTQAEADLLIGKGYAKARNTILYYALKRDIDYLLFWDDDEYPLANIKEGKEVIWKPQTNVLEHIKNIEDAEVTMGYRCGFMNPIPYINYNDEVTEAVNMFEEFIKNETLSTNIEVKFNLTEEVDLNGHITSIDVERV